VRAQSLFGSLAAVICVTGVAFAQAPRRVRLEYERQEGAAVCPEAAVIQAGVAARLGYEPFDDRADDHLRVVVHRSGRALEAHIEMTDAHGALKAERRLVSRQSDCAELAALVELALSIAIDPFIAPFGARPEPIVPTPPAPEKTSPPAAAVMAAPPEPSRPISGYLAAGAVGGIGVTPSRTLGFEVGGGLRRDRLSLGMEGRADLPAKTSLQVGAARTSLLVASLVPCFHFRSLGACALGTAGALRAAGRGLVDSKQVTVPYVALGARFSFAWPITAHLALALHGDLTTPLTQTELKVDGVGIWTSPAVSFALGLGVVAKISQSP
jgi:hypothetical protein